MAAELDPVLADRVAAIGEDHVSGASVLARDAIAVLLDAYRFDRTMVESTARAVCLAQPTMAPVWNAAALAVRPRGLDDLRRLGRQIERAPRALTRVFVEVMLAHREGSGADGGLVVLATVSASESVRSCLEALAGVADIRVICAEARPLMEGRVMAARLAASGIPTAACTDAAIGAVLATEPSVDAVVVGADAVTPKWFINKCGTRLLAESANTLGVPTCVLASRDKFVSARLAAELRPSHGPPQEVWDAPPAGVTVVNPYFEKISLDSVATFVTDVGPVGAGSVADICDSQLRPSDAVRLADILRGGSGPDSNPNH